MTGKKSREIIILEPGKVELRTAELTEEMTPQSTLIEAEVSLVSAGTEGAGFTGLVNEMPGIGPQVYPTRTGYGHIGVALETGSQVTDCKAGDTVLSFCHHGSLVISGPENMALPVPDGDRSRLVFSRMAGVSMAAVRSSKFEVGDSVLIIGMGLVGNFAAQLFQMAGADVMAVDISRFRLDCANECGIHHTMQGAADEVRDAVMDWTGGKGACVVVEAIGKSEVVSQAALLTRKHGETIMLGSPRARATFDATPMLLHIHLNSIKLIGAFEWGWPIHEAEGRRALIDNYRLLLNWINEGKLVVEPLMSHVMSPENSQEAYDGLTTKQDEYLSVVFDWSRIR